MNILHIVYAKMWGGGEQYVYDFCKAGQVYAHQNHIALDPHQTDMIAKFSTVAKTHPVALQGISKYFVCKKLLRLIDSEKIDILVCHSGTMAALCGVVKNLRPQIKLVVYRHNVTPNKKDLYHTWLQRKADLFICVSKLVYDLQIKTAHKEYVSKFQLVYNGIDTSVLTPRDFNYTPKPTFKIGYAGRIVENKGILVLIDALKRLRGQYDLDCELSLAGKIDKSFAEKYETHVKNSGMASFIRGPQFYTDMSSFYKDIDVFVLPTLAQESFGLVLCEAMYSGVPSIATSHGAPTEIIQDKVSGLLVPANHARSLAEQISFLLTHPEQYRAIAQAGHQTVQTRFTTQIMMDKIHQLFTNLLNY